MDPIERKLADLENDFDSAWKREVSLGDELKQDLLNLVIVGAFYLLSWFILFAIFLILSAIGASLLNLKFLIRSFRQGPAALIFLRVIISAIVLPAYFGAVSSTISGFLISWTSQ